MVGKFYRDSKIELKSYSLGFSKTTLQRARQLQRSLDFIEFAISTLDRESQEIILHELSDDADKMWYLELYSSSTYRRKRQKAYDMFIERLRK